MILCSFLATIRWTTLENHSSKQIMVYDQITFFVICFQPFLNCFRLKKHGKNNKIQGNSPLWSPQKRPGPFPSVFNVFQSFARFFLCCFPGCLRLFNREIDSWIQKKNLESKHMFANRYKQSTFRYRKLDFRSQKCPKMIPGTKYTHRQTIHVSIKILTKLKCFRLKRLFWPTLASNTYITW